MPLQGFHPWGPLGPAQASPQAEDSPSFPTKARPRLPTWQCLNLRPAGRRATHRGASPPVRSSTLTKYALIMAFTLALAVPALAQGGPDADFTNALNLYYKQQWPAAQDAFAKVAERNPRDTMAWWYLIHTYYKRNDLHSILYRIEQQAVASDYKDAVALAHLGLGYMVRSMREPSLLDEAQKAFEKALALDENLSIAHCGQGLVFYQRRMMPRAKSHFLSALRANPNDLMASERVGEIIMDDEHNASQAQPFFDTLTRLAPTYPDGWWFTGSAAYDQQQYDRCIQMMQKVMELDPNGFTQGYHAPMLMGKCYLKLKDYPKAEQAFQAALRINPNNREAQFYLEQAKNPPKK